MIPIAAAACGRIAARPVAFDAAPALAPALAAAALLSAGTGRVVPISEVM